MKYHIEGGDSTTGPIGFVAIIEAKNEDEAFRIFNNIYPEWVGLIKYPSKGLETLTLDRATGMRIDLPIKLADDRILELVFYINSDLTREMVSVSECESNDDES